MPGLLVFHVHHTFCNFHSDWIPCNFCYLDVGQQLISEHFANIPEHVGPFAQLSAHHRAVCGLLRTFPNIAEHVITFPSVFAVLCRFVVCCCLVVNVLFVVVRSVYEYDLGFDICYGYDYYC